MTVDARTRASSRCYRLDRLVRADEPAAVCAAVSGRLLGVVATLEPDARLTLTMSARRLGAVTILLHASGVGPGFGNDLAWCGRGSTCGPRSPPPLPCWWSRVVRGWASRCGHDVLPLYVDDPGGVVTRGGRAPVTADKGNDPLRVRSSVTWVRDRSSTGWSSPT